MSAREQSDQARPEIMGIDELAAYLGTTPRHVRRLKYDGRIPFTMVGGRIRFRRSDIDVWLDENTQWPS